MQEFKIKDSIKIVKRGNEKYFRRPAVCYNDYPELFDVFQYLFTDSELEEKFHGDYIPF